MFLTKKKNWSLGLKGILVSILSGIILIPVGVLLMILAISGIYALVMVGYIIYLVLTIPVWGWVWQWKMWGSLGK